jgi:hypothetical protein
MTSPVLNEKRGDVSVSDPTAIKVGWPSPSRADWTMLSSKLSVQEISQSLSWKV